MLTNEISFGSVRTFLRNQRNYGLKILFMTKHLLALSLLAASFSYAQNTSVQLKASPEFSGKMSVLGQRGNVSCGVDTVLYTLNKTSNNETKILYSDGSYSSRAGQFYRASSSVPITVHGFKFYAYAYDPLGGSPTISVDCELFNVGSDSLPTGSALASTSVSVLPGSSTQEYLAMFATPVVMNQNYAVVISNSNTEWLIFTSNDEDTNDGAGEELSMSYYEPAGQWKKNMELWALGDFDFHIFPLVTYNIDAKFTGPTTGCVGIPVNWSNTSSGPWNLDMYHQSKANGDPLSYHWDYGNGNTDAYLKNGTNTYNAVGLYNVTMTDTLFGWTSFCFDDVTETIEIFSIPAAPSASPPSPVCEYTPADSLTATGTGGVFTWYDDSLSNQLGTGSPFSSGITLADTVWVTETLNGCESEGTQVIIDFLPNPIPQFTATITTQGGFTVDFTGVPLAQSYSWDFGDGSGTSMFQSPSYTYAAYGNYNVCVDAVYSNGCTNQYCENVGVLNLEEADLQGYSIFPNPSNGLINVERENATEEAKIELYNIQGKLILSRDIQGTNAVLNLEHLASGSYFLIISDGDNVVQQQIQLR